MLQNQSDPTLNEPNQPESQNPIHSSNYYDWFDCRSKDDDYEPSENGDSYADIEDLVVEDDTSDKEHTTTRDKVRGCNKLYDLAQQLQKEVVEGRLGGKEKSTTSISKQEALASARPECICNTPNYTLEIFVTCLGYNKSKCIFF